MASPIESEGQGRLALWHGSGAKRRAGANLGRRLRPYERSRYAEHGVGCNALGGVRAPPGILIVAPPEIPRNAEGARS